MNKQIKLIDIARMALAMEEKGHKFYSTLAGRVTDERQKQVLMKLAEDKKLFEKIITGYSDDETLDEETSSYLNSIQKHSIFPDLTGVED
jgi:rubrerythrin